MRVLVCVCLVLIAVVPAGAASLFSPATNSMFADYKASAVGDLVTVLIIERSEASQTANTSTSKDASVRLGPGLGALSEFIPLVSLGGDDDFGAQGTTTRGGSVQGKITTRVVEIYGNGTMRIEGVQTILVNGEEQEIVVSGIIRSRDIRSDNTIVSSLVADAQIRFHGSGAVSDKQQPGLLTRLLNWLF